MFKWVYINNVKHQITSECHTARQNTRRGARSVHARRAARQFQHRYTKREMAKRWKQSRLTKQSQNL